MDWSVARASIEAEAGDVCCWPVWLGRALIQYGQFSNDAERTLSRQVARHLANGSRRL